MSTGGLRPAGSRWEIVFTPWLAHPPERVWWALTEPESLRVWFPNEMHGDRSEGSRLRFTFPGKGGEGAFEGEMRTWDPPRALAFRWGEDELRFELGPEGEGTRLTLVDSIDDGGRAARDAAGWHECLDRLQGHLDGRDPGFRPHERREQLHPVYVREFEGQGPPTARPGSSTQHGPETGSAPQEPLASRPLDTEAPGVTPWREARSRLVAAQTYWLSTVRPDRRPHVAPLSGLYVDGLLYLDTRPSSVEADNLAHDPRCAVTIDSRALPPMDLVVEGEAARVSDRAHLQRVAEAYASKYGGETTVRDDVLHRRDAPTGYAVFAVTPTTVDGLPGGVGLGAAHGDQPDPLSPTRWEFTR